jgi:hypothetical protein
MQVNEDHAAGESRDGICDAFLKGLTRIFLPAALRQRVDVAFHDLRHP